MEVESQLISFYEEYEHLLPFIYTIIGFFLLCFAVLFEYFSANKIDNKKGLIPDTKKFKDTVSEKNSGIEFEYLSPDSEDDNKSVLKNKLSKSRNSFWHSFTSLFGSESDQKTLTKETLERFEEILIQSDLGVKTSKKLIESISVQLNNLSNNESISQNIHSLLKEKLLKILQSSTIPEIDPVKVSDKPKVILVVGVNGAGKTTTIGKLAFQFQAQGKKVLIAACDTFRAAAAGQLEVWKDRAGAQIEKGTEGEKPSTVAYRAIHRGIDEKFDVVLIDTAGRLHTRVNLMKELSGILNIISREQPGAPHETILVLDGSTGQNALQQAREFNSSTSITGIVITKLDGSPKGGIVVAIKDELNIPIRYIGVGEGVSDLRPFEADDFVDALLGEDTSS